MYAYLCTLKRSRATDPVTTLAFARASVCMCSNSAAWHFADTFCADGTTVKTTIMAEMYRTTAVCWVIERATLRHHPHRLINVGANAMHTRDLRYSMLIIQARSPISDIYACTPLSHGQCVAPVMPPCSLIWRAGCVASLTLRCTGDKRALANHSRG